MQLCPICQAEIFDDGGDDPQCLACGCVVAWQGDCDSVDLGSVPDASLLLAAGATDSKSDQLGSANIATLDHPSTQGQHHDPPGPLSDHQAEDDLAKRSNREPQHKPESRQLTQSDDEKIRNLWQGTVFPYASPMTSLRTEATATQKDSTLVIRSRAVAESKSDFNAANADYELLESIGEGGMGVVYAARQASIDRVVAVKMLHNETADLEETRDKFLAEAVITAELDHPNIVPIHDLGANERGALFYSMKRVQGTPWCDVLVEKTLPENIGILLKVCDAVAFAHTKGVVHRDLKPENIMLGDFGEVLVMDWGLALPTDEFARADSITQSATMGGTPAYMAPEMASGPLDAIGKQSDVYLLGAILFEIITGKVPHAAESTLACLYAAAANRLQKTNESGELFDIAMKAMATEPLDRHTSVQNFQAAIRDYQSHAESILLSDRAEEELQSARETGDYQAYAAALYGFKESYTLWPGNDVARAGLSAAQLAYAEQANANEDFDLAASLLEKDNVHHKTLAKKIDRSRRERDKRQRRFARLRMAMMCLVAAVFCVVFFAYRMVSADRNKAIAAREAALVEKQKAEEAQENEAAQRVKAQEKEQEAIESKAEAVAALKTAEEKAEEARREKAAKDYESYLAKIGLAAERIDENAFREARAILAELEGSPHVNWEWGRLNYLCRENATRFDAAGRIDAVAFSADGRMLAVGHRAGGVLLYRTRTAREPMRFPHEGQYVHAVAFHPTSNILATGSSDKQIRFFDATTGELLNAFTAHDDSVLSLRFSADGSLLLSTSYDETAVLWRNARKSGDFRFERVQTFRDHSAWVWDADIASDNSRIVTVGNNGKAIAYSLNDADSYERAGKFDVHAGPIYSVSIAPDDHRVATGGYDKRLLVWDANDLSQRSVSEQLASSENPRSEMPSYQSLDGHTAPVQAVRFAPDGLRIVSGSADNSVKVWDASTGEMYKTLRGHERKVTGVAFDPIGKGIVSVSHDKSARLWDVGSYRESRLLSTLAMTGHADAVLSARFSPDGRHVVTASRDRTARIWNVDDTTLQYRLDEGHDFLISGAVFFPDGRRLLTAGGDDSVRLWDLTTGTESRVITGAGRDGAVALSADTTHVLTGRANVGLFWDLTTGKVDLRLDKHSKNISAVACAANSQSLFTADVAGNLALWDAQTGENKWYVRGHKSMVTAAYFLPDVREIITASGDRTVARWRVKTGEEIAEKTLKHPRWVSSLSLSSDGKTAVTTCDDSVVRVWDLETNEVRTTLDVPPNKSRTAANLRRELQEKKLSVEKLAELLPNGTNFNLLDGLNLSETTAVCGVLRLPTSVLLNPEVTSASISRDGRFIVTTAPTEKHVRLWNAVTGEQVNGDAPILDLKTEGGLLWSATFGPDGRTIATLGGNDVRLWNRDDATELMNLSPHGAVASACYSPDGKRVITASWDKSAKIWDATTGRAIRKLSGGHLANVNSASFSPNGRLALTASDDGTAKLWDVTSGTLTGVKLVGHTGPVMSACFGGSETQDSPSLALTTSRDRTARLWNANTGEQLRVFIDDASNDNTSHKLAVLCGRFFDSAAGPRVITGSEDGTVKVWDVASGDLIFKLEAHIAAVTSVGISPDGTRAITGSRDATAKIWDIVQGKEVLTLKGHNQEVTSVQFSPDGRSVLAASRDGLATIWPTQAD